jgi:formamidopyrimidine-DNA glycosylase
MPEIEAHAERIDAEFAGRLLERFVALNFTVLKTAVPPPDVAHGEVLRSVGRRGKYLLLRFDPVVFVVHLMQGGRLEPDTKLAAKPRGGQARFVFDDGPALLLTEQGTERRAGVWCLTPDDLDGGPPLDRLGPEAVGIGAERLGELFGEHSMRVHGFLRDQRIVAGLGRRLANEVCHRARVSPFATTGRLDPEQVASIAAAIDACAADGLDVERARASMSSSKDRPGAVHHRTGEPCPECGDVVRAVEYRGYTVNYCPTCQTGGRILADNTTSKFLK